MEALACVIHQKLDLRLESVEVEEPGPGQVLVRIGAGGICGSDLHYFLAGGFWHGAYPGTDDSGRLKVPTVQAVGAGVEKVSVGDRVALNPSRPCGQCPYCLDGQHQHRLNMKPYGSAMPMPHSQGAFRTLLVVEERQCEVIGDTVSLAEAACAEPLAAALHAVAQYGDLSGRRVLVTGAGPIGCLVVAAARWAGAVEVVAIDLNDVALAKAVEMGASRTINVAAHSTQLADDYSANKGYFEAVFECTGAPTIFRDIVPVLRPRGTPGNSASVVRWRSRSIYW